MKGGLRTQDLRGLEGEEWMRSTAQVDFPMHRLNLTPQPVVSSLDIDTMETRR